MERERLLRGALAAQGEAEAARRETETALAEVQGQRQAADAARRRAAFLAAVTRRLAASLDYEATLREVISTAVPYIADWGLVSVIEPNGQLRLIGFTHRDPSRAQLVSQLAERYSPSPSSTITEAIQTGRPVVRNDATPEQLAAIATTPEDLDLLTRLGTRQFGSWPIPSPDGAVIGALSFVLGDSGRRFSAEDLQTANTLATRAGLHLSNARLYSERSEIAATLQAGLLPRQLPNIPEIDIASAFVAAGRENIVGGDFFDVFQSADGVWTAILGDVSGKGAKAATITAAARHTLRAAALIDPDPTKNLELLNRILISDTEVGEFCTVVYARLCPAGETLTANIAHAGHPPSLVLRHSGSVEVLRGGRGPLVGIDPEAQFTAIETKLRPGDLLLLYTDGVTEARPSDVAFGERELMTTLAAYRARPAHDVAEAVKSRALKLQGGNPRDDIAILAIRIAQ